MTTAPVPYLIRNVQVVKPSRILTGDIGLRDGVIDYIGEPIDAPEDYTVVDGTDHYVVPGFIDIHCHGGNGFDFTVGRYDLEQSDFDSDLGAYPERLSRLMATMAKEGTTRVLLTTVAAPSERLEAVLAQGAEYALSERNGCDGTELFGTFIEGTFIRNRDYAGAQNADYFMKPDREVFDRLDEAASGTIRYVNIVPEYGEAALDLTGYLSERGILVGAGHVSCSAEMYQRAEERGLRIAVHFTNGPTGSSFKPFGGGSVLQSVLTSRRVFVELIGDGYHVNPSYLLDIMSRKGSDRVVAITDAMFVTGSDEITGFQVSGVEGAVSETRDYLKVVEKENTLFGSMLTMRVAFSNWISWLTRQMPGIWVDEHDPLGLDEAILTASHLCATNPARVLRILDPVSRHLGQKLDNFVGSLEVGKRADVVLLKLDGSPGQYKADVRSVFVKGRKVV